MRTSLMIGAGIALCGIRLAQAQTEMRLWPGAAPGSEAWSIAESVTRPPSGGRVIINVSDPSLTVFLPDPSIATGTAVVIAPGGALRALAFDNEGVKVTEWLNPRLFGRRRRRGRHGARAEIRASPDFLVSVYGPSLQDVIVPEHAPPLFIAVGSTHFNVTNGCLALFAAWKAAGKPAEMHVYDQVNGGFGMRRLGLPVDTWTDRLYDWLVARGLTSARTAREGDQRLPSHSILLGTAACSKNGPTRMAGMLETKSLLEDLHTPTPYILGGPSDIAYENRMDDFALIDDVPVAVANIDTGHGGTYWEPNGGAAAEVVVAWLDWRLRGNAESGRKFVGQNCGLCVHPKWTFESKRLD